MPVHKCHPRHRSTAWQQPRSTVTLFPGCTLRALHISLISSTSSTKWPGGSQLAQFLSYRGRRTLLLHAAGGGPSSVALGATTLIASNRQATTQRARHHTVQASLHNRGGLSGLQSSASWHNCLLHSARVPATELGYGTARCNAHTSSQARQRSACTAYIANLESGQGRQSHLRVL
jgi:hypothetical protein